MKNNNEVMIFQNEEFGNVRTVTIDDEIWFVGKDVANALGYARATKAIQDHVDEEDKDAIPIQDSIGRMQNTPVINISGMYALIFGSKLNSAKRFKRWVTSEVLPSIQKTGGYLTEELKQYIEQTILTLTNRVKELEQRLDVIGAFDNEWMLKKIQDATKSKVMKMTENPIHKTLWSRFFFAGIYKELKDTFHVSTLKSIPSANLDDALSIIHYWYPTDSFLKTRLIRLKANQELNLLQDKKIIALLQYLKETNDGAINPFAMQTEE